MGLGVQAMMRARTAAVVTAILLSGCGSNTDQSRYANLVWGLISGDRAEVSRDQAAMIPFASISVSLGRNDEGLMVLGLSEGARQEWYARNQMIAMNNGRILQTNGFPYDLSRLEIRARDGSTITGGPPTPDADYSLVLDFADLRLIGAVAACRSSNAGEEAIDILDTALTTRHVVETCLIPTIDWSFENEFWIDPDTNFVWQSSQHIHPKLPPVLFRVLRPPS